MTKEKLVRLVPVPDRWLAGVPAVECEVSEAEAERLTATGAFTVAIDALMDEINERIERGPDAG